MRVDIPHSAMPITRLTVTTPDGEIEGEFTQDHKVFEFDLPEGVTEDEVGISVSYLTNGRAIASESVLKYAVEKPAGPPSDPPADESCDCGESEACSNCGPEDEIAEPKDE